MCAEAEVPLSPENLEAAACLCLAHAATTDLDGGIVLGAGWGWRTRREHHERRRRFEEAARRKKENPSASLQDLGLSPDDLAWAAGQAERAKDPEAWASRFTAAEETLVGPLNAEALRRIASLTYAVQHNPNCPREFLVRLVGPGAGVLDYKPERETCDVLGHGKRLYEAVDWALDALERQQESAAEACG